MTKDKYESLKATATALSHEELVLRYIGATCVSQQYEHDIQAYKEDYALLLATNNLLIDECARLRKQLGHD